MPHRRCSLILLLFFLLHVAHTAALRAGEALPASVRERLGCIGSRAAIAFVVEDEGFQDAKHILAMAEATESFRARACKIFVVRSPRGARDSIVQRYPSLSFVDDADNLLRQQVDLPDGGGFFGAPERATLVCDEDGNLCGTVSNAVEASAHAAYALRFLCELDERLAAADEAARKPAAIDELRKLVIESATPSDEEAVATEVAERRKAAAALRAQAVRAEANRNVKWGFGRTTLEAEGQRLASEAAKKLASARSEEAEWRAARARAEAAGDTAAAERHRAEAEASADRASNAREDEIAALRIEADAVEEQLTAIRLTIAKEEIQVNETARRAYGYRRLATASAVALEDANERGQMRRALEVWASRQAEERPEDQQSADGYRAAVEAAWEQTQQDDGAQEAAAAEAQRWAERLSLADPAELRQAAPPPPPTRSVSQAATYKSASADVAKAEEEEATAQRWAAQLEATRRRQAVAQQRRDALEVRMGQKAAVDERKKKDAADATSSDMRAALEVALFGANRPRAEAESDTDDGAAVTDAADPVDATGDQLRKIAELEAQIAALKGQQRAEADDSAAA